MTVQELIDKLSAIEDKYKTIVLYRDGSSLLECTEVENHNDYIELW